MKRQLGSIVNSRSKKIACTVSAAALMLGVSSAATIGLHFQCDYYCSSNLRYTGYPVTMTAFGIASNAWENLYQIPTAYHSCDWTSPGYLTNEVIDTDTSTNGLNPLPNGSINVTWFANCANFAPFYGYAASPPYYTGGGPLTNPKTGEQQVYATFLRDGINFGPDGPAGTSGPGQPYGSPDNDLEAYYYVDITGLNTLFTNTPFVVELMVSADSMYTTTNAFIIDVADSITNSVIFPGLPPVQNQNNAPWPRGIGGGLSTSSGVFSNVTHLHIMSNIPQHVAGEFNNGGTISGFIMTDKPVVSMSPQSVALANVGDTAYLSAYAIGVPPLSYQWQFNGQNIPGATATNYTVSNLTMSTIGDYALVVTNLYGTTTSAVSSVGAGHVITQTPTPSTNVVYDSNPDNPQHNGLDMGATWLASSTDSSSVTRTGVMSFGPDTNAIVVEDNTNFDGSVGTISFWMRSAGTDTNDGGITGAAIIVRPVGGSQGLEFALVQLAAGNLELFTPNDDGNFTSVKNVSDNKWHFVALTFSDTTPGGAALFIDGALDSTNGGNVGSWSTAGDPIDIGSGTDNYYQPYVGLLNDVRYYSSILRLAQLSSIQTSGALADTNALQLEFEFAAPPGPGLNLSWPDAPSVLQSAPTVIGPWTPVIGVSTPYTIIPATNQQFFRYIYSNTNGPQTNISNPYLM